MPTKNAQPGVYRLNENILTRIWLERLRQKKLFREEEISFDVASPVVSEDRKLRVATEELGEVAEAIDLLERRLDKKAAREALRDELTQLVAVGIAWLESLEVA